MSDLPASVLDPHENERSENPVSGHVRSVA